MQALRLWQEARRTSPPSNASWWPPGAALLGSSVAIGGALLAPRWFSDPVGVDPYLIRLAAITVILLAASALEWLRPVRGVFLAIAAICAPFSLWLGGTRLCTLLLGDRLSPTTQTAVAGALQLLLVGTFAAARHRTPGAPASLGLRVMSWRAAAAAVVGTTLILAVAMVVPAQLLGREGLQPAAMWRDGVWLLVAGVFQAASQEVAFRGLLLGALEGGMPPWAANAGQAMLFGLAHLAVQYEGPAAPFVPVTIALGLALGLVTQRTGSLWPAIVIHSAADVGVSFAVIPGLYGY